MTRIFDARDDGGPAFPQPLHTNMKGDMDWPSNGWGVGGMSLRDWFAAHAPLVKDAVPARDAVLRYKWADVMLEARRPQNAPLETAGSASKFGEPGAEKDLAVKPGKSIRPASAGDAQAGTVIRARENPPLPADSVREKALAFVRAWVADAPGEAKVWAELVAECRRVIAQEEGK